MPLLLLTLTLLAAQDFASDERLDAKVAVQKDAMPLPKLAAVLGADTKLDLTADTSLWGQIVYISCGERPLRELLTKIADVTDCEWKPSGSGYRLAPAQEKRAATNEVEHAARLKGIQDVYKQFRELAGAPYTEQTVLNYLHDQKLRQTQEGWERNAELFKPDVGPQKESYGALAEGRLMSRVMLAIDPVALAEIKVGQRVVFSSKPNKMQRAFHVDLSSIGALYQSDQKTVRAAQAKFRKEQGRKAAVDEDEESPADFTATKIEVAVSRVDMFGMENLNSLLQVFDKDGTVTVSTNCGLWASAESVALLASIGDKPKESDIPLKPDSITQRKLFAEGFDEKSQPSNEKLALRPDLVEPLSLYPSDLLTSFAKQCKKDIVAELPDSSVCLALMDAPDDRTTESLRARVEATIIQNVSQDPNWLLYRPRNPTTARPNQIDRSAVSWFLSPEVQRASPGFANYCKYLYDRKTNSHMNVVELSHFMMEGLQSIWMESNFNHGMLFIGSLDPTSRIAFMNGTTLTYGRLPVAQKALLDQMCFGTEGPQSLGYDFGPDDVGDVTPVTEPTDVCPNGIPFDSPVVMKQSDEPLLYSMWADSKTWAKNEVDEVAWALALKRNPKFMPDAERRALPPSFRIGWRRSYEFRLWVAKKVYFGFDYSEDAKVPAPRDYSYDELPGSVRQMIEGRAKEIAEGKIDRFRESKI